MKKYCIPSLSVPISVALEHLYLNETDDMDIRWKLVGWIMSISDNIILAMQQLPKQFLVICTALYCLVKVIPFCHPTI